MSVGVMEHQPHHPTYWAPWIAVVVGLLVFVPTRFPRLFQGIPLYCNYHVWLYFVLLGLTTSCVYVMMYQVMLISDWLDPVATQNFVAEVIQLGKQPADDFAKWQAEASLDEYGYLRVLSLLSPIFTVLTFLVCSWHTVLHLYKINQLGGRPEDGKQHDRTIFVVALPLFYCLMSFLSVIRTWQVCINHVGASTRVHIFSSFEDRKDFLFQMYDTNFMVGDVYETFALVLFGKLLTTYLDQVIQRDTGEAMELGRVGDNDETGDIDEGEREAESEDALRAIIKKLRDATSDLTLGGVRLFNYTCRAQAAYTLFVTTMGFWGYLPEWFSPAMEQPGFFQTISMRSNAKFLFMGMGIVASSAAITHLLAVEEQFKDFLRRFSPSAKFWSTKILVTLAFLQSILIALIAPFLGWTETRSNLFYSSFLCAECFFLSLFHLKAWDPNEDWYAGAGAEAEARYMKATEKTQTKAELLEEVKGNLSYLSSDRIDAEVEKLWSEAAPGDPDEGEAAAGAADERRIPLLA